MLLLGRPCAAVLSKRSVSYLPKKVNYYEILGVKSNASLEEIKTAFAKKSAEMKEAYDCLRNPKRRAAYDDQVVSSAGYLREATHLKFKKNTVIDLNRARDVAYSGPRRGSPQSGCHFRKDYYQILGLKRDATQRQIKAAYYELSKKYHPDVAGRDAGAQAKFIEITEAYECLKDPEKRRIYDNEGGYGHRQNEDRFKFKVWKEFNRMRNERESYDARMRREGEKLWEEFIKERATREHEFRTRYGAPGSFRYTWRWAAKNPTAHWNLVLLGRIFIAYMVCVVVVTFFQVVLSPLFHANTSSKSSRGHDVTEEQPKEENEATQFHYMNQPPPNYGTPWSDVISKSYPRPEIVDSRSVHDNLTSTPT
ncbi:unnamed protein product [Angiostrongylus costaricensis]|uniref:DnaJ homolog subfamily B member 9 n=1 Tax=Angiostrongylus costaricensis TaxID=334426 RepID=A0A0R3PV96_ANGCS|nr:unnamed protein product [Angiostrongylus costaricensis]